jgi:alanine-synthesizing transaminase
VRRASLRRCANTSRIRSVFAKRTEWNLAPNRFARSLEAHRASGKKLYDLTASNPTIGGFHYPEQRILAAISDPRALQYSPESKGLRSAREAVAGYYSAHRGYQGAGCAVDPEQIILTASTSEAYSYIFRLLCEVGDEILVPSPSYPLFEFLAALNDVKLVPYQLLYDHGWHVDFASLRAAVSPRTRAVLVVNPNNPTGSILSEREASGLLALCAQPKVAIIADEVFVDFVDDDDAARTFAGDTRVLTFVISGLSKISALPQMKLAWLVTSGPERLVSDVLARLDVIADTYLSPGTPVQIAAPELLRIGGEMRQQLRERVQANLAKLDASIASAPHIARLARAGGWYAVVRVPATQPDEEMAVALLERKSTLVHPGQFFDFAQDGFVVVSLIAPQQEFAEGLHRLVEFFSSSS